MRQEAINSFDTKDLYKRDVPEKNIHATVNTRR